MQVRKNLEERQNTAAPGGPKVGSLNQHARNRHGRCEIKNACHCGTQYIQKEARSERISLRALLDVEMSKKCTPSRRKAYFEVKKKTEHFRKLSC